MFRRPLRRMIVRSLAQSALSMQMNHAEELLSGGHADQAAILYSRLAQEAEQRIRPRQAANLHTRAAYIWLEADQEASAQEHAQKAVALFNNLGMAERAGRFQERFEQRLQMKKGGADIRFAQPLANQHGRVPTTCPQCGAPLRSDEVEWVDENSIECDFCGAAVRTE